MTDTPPTAFTASQNGFIPVALTGEGANERPRAVALTPASVNENSPAGTVVGTLTAVDPDGDPLTWTLTDDAGGRFTVDAQTGVVRVAAGAAFDFETRQSYTIVASASDGTLSTATTPLTVAINDVNEAPRITQFIIVAASQVENNPTAAHAVAYMQFADDFGANAFTLSGPDAGLFFVMTTGPRNAELWLLPSLRFDYETQQSYAVTVNLVDPTLGPDPFDARDFTLTIVDGDDPPRTDPVTITLNEDDVRVLTLADFPHQNDDPYPLLRVEIAEGPSNGRLMYDADGGDPSNAVAVTSARTVTAEAIAAGKLWFVPDANESGNSYASFAFNVADQEGLSNRAGMTFIVNPVNDAPVWKTGSNAQNYRENATVLLEPVTIKDAELDALNGGLGDYAGATVTLMRDGGANADDVFGFAASPDFSVAGNTLRDGGGHIIAGFTATGGSLTITFANNGAAPTSLLVHDILRHISYTNPRDDLPDQTVTLRWQFDDGNDGAQGPGLSLTASATTMLDFEPRNDAPVNAVPGAQQVGQDAAHVFGGATHNAITVSDPDAGSQEVSLDLRVGHGTLMLAQTTGLTRIIGNGGAHVSLTGTLADINAAIDGLTYRPAAGYTGSDTLTVASDDLGHSGGGSGRDQDTIALNVGGGNVAPESQDASLSGTEDTALQVTLSGTDSDGMVAFFRITTPSADGGLFADAAGVTPIDPDHIAAIGGSATVWFVPHASFNGPTGFQYVAVDDHGTPDDSPATISLSIDHVNEAPTVAHPLPDRTVAVNTPVEIQFAVDAFVDDGSGLTYAATLTGGDPLPAWLTFDAATRTFSGLPPQNFVGEIAIVVTADDGQLTVSDSFLLTISNAGNDVLVSGTGTGSTGVGDIFPLNGGTGDDVYAVADETAEVTEDTGGGTDTVYASVTYTMPDNVEGLVLQETGGAIDGSGGDGEDTIIGNGFANRLDGGGGSDALIGGSGNDVLVGGAEIDGMAGGTGDDTYVVDSSGDQVTEQAGEGSDTVYAGSSFTLTANVEGLVLLDGAGAIDGTGSNGDDTIIGNASANRLDGGDGSDALIGGGGNDVLIGGAGVDGMAGGLGDDVYAVDSTLDQIQENLGEGADTVYAGASFTLTANLEALVLTDGAGAIDGAGNDDDNYLFGNGADNMLHGHGGTDVMFGGGGRDTLVGDGGDDVLTGGADDDVFSFAGTFGHDTVADFTAGDRISLDHAQFASFSAVQAHMVAIDATTTQIVLDADNTITVHHAAGVTLTQADFLIV